MPLLQACCMTASLRTGCLIIGILMLITSLLVCGYPSYEGFALILATFIYIDCIITAITSILFLVFGIYVDRLWAMIMYANILVIKIFVDLILFIFAIILGSKFIFNLINAIFMTFYNMYCFWVVYSYYRESAGDLIPL